MANEYPFLAFTFKGRIKSLIRAESKFNGYIVEYISDYYNEHGHYPSTADEEMKYLYDVANQLPGFLKERGFTAELSTLTGEKKRPC